MYKNNKDKKALKALIIKEIKLKKPYLEKNEMYIMYHLITINTVINYYWSIENYHNAMKLP